MKKYLMGISLTAITAAGLGVPEIGFVQGAHAYLDEIVVTSQRREQSLQDVPIAVTTWDTDTLVKTGVDELNDLVAIVPGLTGRNQGVATAIYGIRGVNSNSFGVGGDNAVGIFVDDVFVGRQAISGVAFLDVDRIEVLKGPQGTLFGRNSSAGAISIVSKKPGYEPAADFRVSYGNLDSLEAFGGVTLPLIQDKLTVRLAGLRRDSNGTEFNVLNGQRIGDNDLWAGRATIRLDVNERLSLEGFFALWRQETTGYAIGTTDPMFAALAPGSSADPFDRLVGTNVDLFERRDAEIVGFTINYDITDNITMKSISSYTRIDDQGVLDVDGTPLPGIDGNFGPDGRALSRFPGLTEGQPGETVGQEIRFNGSTDKIDWLFGASYFAESVGEPITLGINDFALVAGTPVAAGSLGFPNPAFVVCDATSDAIFGPCNGDATETVLIEGNYSSYAIFGDLRYAVTEALALTVGLRYSYDTKRFKYNTFIEPSVLGAFSGGSAIYPNTFASAVVLKNSWNDLQPRFVVDYEWNPDLRTYASVSRGFKSGGFDISLNPADIPFGDESVWAYEVGLKSTWFDGRANLNAAIYYNDYSGLQAQSVVAGIQQTENIPSLDSYGFEVEIFAKPIENLTINVGTAFNDTEFGTFITSTGNLEGNRLPNTSRWTFNAGAEYVHNLTSALDVYIRGDADFRSREFDTLDNLDQFSQDGLWLINGRLGFVQPYNDTDLEIAMFARNIFDEEYTTFRQDFGFGPLANPARPRTWGVEVRGSF